MKSREKEFYELAGLELFNGNYKVGLWNMAFSSALGDDAKSRALYMKVRVEEMEAEATRSMQRRSTILDTELPEGLATRRIFSSSRESNCRKNIPKICSY